MQVFEYIARDHQKNMRRGNMVSSDASAVTTALNKMQLIPIKIEQIDSSASTLRDSWQRLFFSKLLFLSIFTTSLRRLLHSGLTIPQSISVISRQFRRKYVSSRLSAVHHGLEMGQKLSQSLQDFPELFPNYLVALCRAGEDSGCLEEVFAKAAVFFEKFRELRSKISSALVYPLFLGLLSIATVIILFTFILPRITVVYQQLNADLPWQTEWLLATGRFVSASAFYILGMVIIAVIWLAFLGSQRRISSLAGLKYKMPYLGKILAWAELADQLSVIGILISHGATLPNAIRIATSLTEHSDQRRDFESIATRIEAGESLSETLARTETIPEYARDIISLGEEADCLADSFENSSDIIKNNVEQRLTMFTTLFEPTMILIAAVVIGFVVFSVLLPIFNMDFAI